MFMHKNVQLSHCVNFSYNRKQPYEGGIVL
ncbi:hypothetical protein JOD44_002556 [Salimicrobium jeotgali]|nr:hypothetical protein [Salimicrobium jeotgali]